MTVANAIVKSMKTHKRKKADWYPTPVAGTAAIIPVLVDLGVSSGALIGEPACGNGAMARILKRDGGYEVVASDLRHTGFGLGGYDYLKDGDDPVEGSLGWFAEYGLLDAIVTNPPFDLAEAFIRKAVQQAPVVAMLLKSNYWNSRRGLKFYDEGFGPTHRYPVTWRLAFLEEERGKAPLMDCDWFVWRRGDPPVDRPLSKPKTVEPLESMLTVSLGELGFAIEALTEAVRGGT